MSIEVRESTASETDTWNSYVEQSPHANLFHRREALDVLARHTDSPVHTLVGYKGQEPVGIFPVFEIEKGPITTAFSPPPDLRVPYLGPALLNMDKLKQRKAERRHRSFLDGCFEWLDERLTPRYVHLRLDGVYPDLRPLKWAGFEVTPAYTYHVDLTPDEEDLLLTFSSDARSNVRDGRDDDAVTVTEGDRDAISFILQQVRDRYESQGIAFHLPTELVEDLYDDCPDGAIRPYVCEVDGRRVGGILAYEFGDRIARWQGGVRTDVDVDVAVNDVLDWTVMRTAKARGVSTYDLVGAENERINTYKAKFNPELRPYYSVERGSTAVNVAAHVYKRLRATSLLDK